MVVTVGCENSATKTMYSELNTKIEQATRAFYFIGVKVTTLFSSIPFAILTLYNYFVSDLGDESYYLSVPVMYV